MPTRRWPSVVIATIDGVVLMPSLFSNTLGEEPSITATQEFVVPKSMPTILALLRRSGAPKLSAIHVARLQAANAALEEERKALDIAMGKLHVM
mmetsp:Transcript_97220/g.192639  ORF Transcript_97220/g.192639 Transcript_97220/m.192639 type:complete len:94 (+) Transcript_97220:1933-2214(+)